RGLRGSVASRWARTRARTTGAAVKRYAPHERTQVFANDSFARAGFTAAAPRPPKKTGSDSTFPCSRRLFVRARGKSSLTPRSCMALAPAAFDPAEARQYRRERKCDGQRRHEKRRKPVPGAARVVQPQARIHRQRRNDGGRER